MATCFVDIILKINSGLFIDFMIVLITFLLIATILKKSYQFFYAINLKIHIADYQFIAFVMHRI